MLSSDIVKAYIGSTEISAIYAGILKIWPPAVAGDPLWYRVVCLCHFDGTNGSTAFVDERGGSFTATTGSPALATTDPMYGSAYLDLGGSNRGLTHTFANPVTWTATDDFCIEGSFRVNSISGGSRALFSLPGVGWEVYISTPSTNDHKIFFYTGVNAIQSGGVYDFTKKCTFALERVNGVITLYLNGVAIGTSNNGTAATNIPLIYFGTWNGSGEWLKGHLDEFRITVGAYRYGSNYTPSADPFPHVLGALVAPNDDANTLVLEHLDALGGTDEYGHTKTNSTNAVLSVDNSGFGKRFGPIAKTDQISVVAATTARLITLPATIEFRAQMGTALHSDSNCPALVYTNGSATSGLLIGLLTSGAIRIENVGNNVVISGSTRKISNSRMHHVEIGITTTQIFVFIDGYLSDTITPANPALLTGAKISRVDVGNSTYSAAQSAFIDELRISEGILRHNTSFKIPQLPYVKR